MFLAPGTVHLAPLKNRSTSWSNTGAREAIPMFAECPNIPTSCSVNIGSSIVCRSRDICKPGDFVVVTTSTEPLLSQSVRAFCWPNSPATLLIFMSQTTPVIGRIRTIIQLPPGTTARLADVTVANHDDTTEQLDHASLSSGHRTDAHTTPQETGLLVVLERFTVGGRHAELDMPTLHRPVEPQPILAAPEACFFLSVFLIEY